MTDRIVTAITDDGAFRVISLISTETTKAIAEKQHCTGPLAEKFSDLITASVLFRVMMAPQLRVQAILQGAKGVGTMVADSYPEGATRGLVHLPNQKIDLGTGAMLQLLRTMPRGDIYDGTVMLDDQAQIAHAMTTYLHNSEQITSSIHLKTVLSPLHDTILHSGGFVVQLLPEATEPPLFIMYERLAHDALDLASLVSTGNPEAMIDHILYKMPHAQVYESTAEYKCQCSEVRVLASMAALGEIEIRDIISKGEVLDIVCDYCMQHYSVRPEQLHGLLLKS